eukprot:COSAG06_NODE_22219_length_729_cov_1.335975_1_plen_59_part_10
MPRCELTQANDMISLCRLFDCGDGFAAAVLDSGVDQRGAAERRAAAHRCCCGVVSFAVS